ncbi:uncharacterized protein F5891DRAFT_987529 [Suillus fuscotomentosus]|uniref:Uncharacterized protein n=1 Tax=Suillus fuscotomentosus TaxID=1912939 RepID=A0AAD4DPZ4_9AGAM|nr:uncharacterized protein F5891DRAFT_987529 [Suillus fuscotomentosus]KAG1889043.1 hypothetical protein F5891DRAFT_987529 [Suillus fuscotomentosus]
MAPRKWTTSEQEAWLEPWYQKFAEQQSDKSRNHQNFFADLYEKWIVQFTHEKPGTKAGQQAKANANDVFDAVVRKITECEKPTRMLQEHEAYSKLYYADRVQKSIQETLKVAQATQSLTNGQRVALLKKETATLYAGESEEIKAKVREYIHAQKEERGKEKAEPWSDEDQQRNLTKLATIANQFLKGLADATGLSFSLLVGGPSAELGGMIDVWSFHVGMTKLGNNFSQAYPKFESEIVGPFRDYLYSEAAILKDQKMGGASSSRSSWGDSVCDENQSSYPVMDELSKWDKSLSGTLGLLDISEFPSSSNAPTLSTLPFSSDNIISGNNQPNWQLADDGLDDFLETLAQNLPMSTVDYLMSHVPPSAETPSVPVPAVVETPYCPLLPVFPRSVHGAYVDTPEPSDGIPPADSLPSGFAHPTAHLPGNEEPNSNRPDALPPSSMAEDHTEDSSPPTTSSHTSASANVVNEAQANEVQTAEVQTAKGDDNSGLRRTRRAHIPSTRNSITNSIGNNCKENAVLNLASKCSHNTDSSARVGQQAKRPRV